MAGETSDSSENERRIVFPGALSSTEQALGLNPEALAKHQVDAEITYTDLKVFLHNLGVNYYDGLRDVADKMEGRKRGQIARLRKLGEFETSWPDRLDVTENSDFDSYDFDSVLIYDKDPATLTPILRSYSVGITNVYTTHEKGPHPHTLVEVIFGQDDIQKLSMDNRSVRIRSSSLGQIAAKKSGIAKPDIYGYGTTFGAFLQRNFGLWENEFDMELIFHPEPEIMLIHKGGNYKKTLRSGFKFSIHDSKGNPEVTFRGTAHPKNRDPFKAPTFAGYQDTALTIPEVKEIYSGAMLVLPGKAA